VGTTSNASSSEIRLCAHAGARLGPDDCENLRDCWEPAIQLDEEQAIMVRELDATMRPAPQDNQLMSKHRVLSCEPQLRLEWRQSEAEQPDHPASLGDSITASHSDEVYTRERPRNMDNLTSLAPSLNQLSTIIGSVAAPAFLLGAVAAFISVLISRMNRVIDRSQFLHKIPDSDESAYLKADISRLKRRAKLLNRSVLYATVSAIVTALLVIVAFVSAMLHFAHEYGVALLFILALAFFLLSLVNLARETNIGLHEYDHHA